MKTFNEEGRELAEVYYPLPPPENLSSVVKQQDSQAAFLNGRDSCKEALIVMRINLEQIIEFPHAERGVEIAIEAIGKLKEYGCYVGDE